MLKKILKRSVFFLFGVIIFYVIARFFDVNLGSLYDADRAPYLQVPTTNSIIIRWQTKKPNIGVVRIGESVKKIDKIFKEQTPDDEHQLALTGLKANTKYYYRVGTPKYSIYEGENYWFKTSPNLSVGNEDVSPVRFWVTGDQGQAGDIQNQVRDAMLAWVKNNPLTGTTTSHLNFWLTTGDNAYRSGTNQQFQDNFFLPYQSILINTPVWPAYGNHDARRKTFSQIFSFPAKGESGGVASNSKKYYSFDYGSAHVVVLDSQTSRMQKNSRMLRWLKKDLATTTQKWLIAVLHHPPYTKGTHHSDNPADSFNRMQNVRRYVLPILEQGGVDVVLAGHSHMYERSWFMNCHYGNSSSFTSALIRDGELGININSSVARMAEKGKVYEKDSKENSATVYITIGSSSKLDQGDLDHPAMPLSLHKSGSLVFDLIGNKLIANFITEQGAVADNFTIIKAAALKPAEPLECP